MSDSQEKYGPEKDQEKYGPEKDQEKYDSEKDEPEQPTPQPPGSENSGGPRSGVEGGQPQAPPVQIKSSSGDEVNPAPPTTSSWTPTPGPSREPNTPENPYISEPTSWHFRPMDETRARRYDKICQKAAMNQAFSRRHQGLSIRERGGDALRRKTIDVTKIGKLRKTNDPTKIKGWKHKFPTGEFSPSSRPNTPSPPSAWVPKNWALHPALSWDPPTQTATPWPTMTSVRRPLRALMPPPSSTITSGAVMSPPSSTITPGALMPPPSSTITPGALMPPPSSTITPGALMPPPSSTITPGALMPSSSSTTTSGASMTPPSSTTTSGASMTPPSTTITFMDPPTFAPPTWTTTTEPSCPPPTKAFTSGFPTIKLGAQKKKSLSPQQKNPIMQVNPAPPATSSWTPTPGPSREPNTPGKPFISKPTSWHFRPLDETIARKYDKIFQENEMNQAFSRPNQGLSIREGGGASIRREIIDVSKIGDLRKTNDPTKIKGWKRKFGLGVFLPSNRSNTPNPSEPQTKIPESPESPPKKIPESPESPESPPKKQPRMQVEEPAEDSRVERNLSEGEDDTPLDELVDFMIDEEDDETPVEWILPPPDEREPAVPEAASSVQEYIELSRNEEMIKRILINTLNNLQFHSWKFHGEMLEIRSSNELATVNPASDKKWKYADKVLIEASPNAVRINVAAEDIRHHVEEIGKDFMPKGWYGITLTLCEPIEGYDVALHVARNSEAETSRIVNIVLCVLEMIINIINEMKSDQPQ